jgi:hypothetical protein
MSVAKKTLIITALGVLVALAALANDLFISHPNLLADQAISPAIQNSQVNSSPIQNSTGDNSPNITGSGNNVNIGGDNESVSPNNHRNSSNSDTKSR